MAAQAAPPLRAGVGKADIQPQTGYVLGGWTRADRTAQGQHTRLQSRALVLERGPRRVALVQVDLFMIPGGMVKQIGARLAARGFSEQNILISASHTHSGPGGFANFPTLNTTAPSLETAGDPNSFAALLNPAPADPQLYTFLVEQIEAAIRRADDDLDPALAGWAPRRCWDHAQPQPPAHLANHGILREYGEGSEQEDPGGYRHTVVSDVNVLRVDKLLRRRVACVRRGAVSRCSRRVRVPIGGWSTFADHGTVTKSSFEYYNADHNASAGGGVPNGIPLTTLRVGPRLIASVPGEGTKEVGARIETAVGAAVAGSGIEEVVISGLANEFVLYLTTPEEYDRQHYEGGNTQFGRQSSNLIKQSLAQLAGSLVRGAAAPAPYAFDPTNGVVPDGPPYPSGAAAASAPEQPAPAYGRLQRATLSWSGGPLGLDRPVDREFISAQQQIGGRWITRDTDLGLAMLWSVDEEGRYTARWEIPRSAPRGRYRLVVTAKRYRLESRPFQVNGTGELRAVPAPADPGRVAVRLEYPAAIENTDLTFRPQFARGGVVRFRVGGRTVAVRSRDERVFSVRVPPGASVTVPAAAGRDRFGNVNGRALTLR